MLSRRCAALLFSLVATLNQVCDSTYQLKTGDECTRQDTALSSVLSSTVEDPCYKFRDDNKKFEFYSPGYPGLYSNNTECFLVLTAPPGQNIKLDFRDRFAIEPSENCKNDFLEVRDGANGYNKMKHPLFCGYGFPPMIISSDRHLWIHFKSDENIECGGFKAVYTFINRTNPDIPENKPCLIELSGDEGLLNKSNIDNETLAFNRRHNLALDCLWKITVKEGWKIQLSFIKFNLDKPNDCDSNFLDVFSNNTDIPSRERNFCGSIADAVSSKGNVMYIRFYVENRANKSNFEALFTAYRENEKNADCRSDEFNCDDGKCISASLRCNERNNCHFMWDEDECDKNKKTPLSENHIIIIMVIFSLILSGMCFTFIFNCVRKLIRDHQTIQEYIRESREQQLNELGKQEQFEKKTSKLTRSRSNSTQSSDSQRFAAVNAMTNTSCYVPGGELLPIMIRNEHSLCANSNGDAYNQTMHPYDNDNTPQPEMCDSACQTRESLFTTHAYSSTHSTPNHSIASSNSKPSPPAPFSTFGYRKEKYRAEAKIEMERIDAKANYEEKKRPYSVQTTKSAPDVIVTH